MERIAEELMGRRKWKLYQESMSRNYLQPLNNNIKKPQGDDTTPITKSENHEEDSQKDKVTTEGEPTAASRPADASARVSEEVQEEVATESSSEENRSQPSDQEVDGEARRDNENGVASEPEKSPEEEERLRKEQQEAEDRLKDWTPQKECYFCTDGKVEDQLTNHGSLVSNNLLGICYNFLGWTGKGNTLVMSFY